MPRKAPTEEKIGPNLPSNKSHKGRCSNDPTTNLFCLHFDMPTPLFLAEMLVFSRNLLLGGLLGLEGRQLFLRLFYTRQKRVRSESKESSHIRGASSTLSIIFKNKEARGS